MKTLTTLIILLWTLSNLAQEKRCLDFRTGEFQYVKFERPEKIIRTDSLQIETNPFDNIIVETAIEWISDCEYVMTYKTIINHPKDVSSVIGNKIYCEIIETKGDMFKVHAKSDVTDEIIEFVKVDEIPKRLEYTVSVDRTVETYIEPYIDSLNLSKTNKFIPDFLNRACFDYDFRNYVSGNHNPISLRKKIISSIEDIEVLKYLLRHKRMISDRECSELLEHPYGGQPNKMDSQEETTLSMLKTRLNLINNRK